MSFAQDPFVPKVHPLDRDADVEDPFELMAQPVVGDPDVMLECILQEFAWMGWDSQQLWELFHHPGYPVLGELRAHYGDGEIRRRVDALAQRWGRLRFRETIVEPEVEPQLVQIALPVRQPSPPTGADGPPGPVDVRLTTIAPLAPTDPRLAADGKE